MVLLLLLASVMLPLASAHDPPPETGGMQFAISGESDSLTLYRGGYQDAVHGSRIVVSGGSGDLGTWTSDELLSPLHIEQTRAILVMYVQPIGIVLGSGVWLEVEVKVDGDVVMAGDSETIILNEPLMTNVPWISEEFSLDVEAGQSIEVHVIAHLEGAGAGEFHWAFDEAPAVFSLQNWAIDKQDAVDHSTQGDLLRGTFETPWNCTDVEDVALEVQGPVDDHDAPWSPQAAVETLAVSGEACERSADITDFDGTYLHRWVVRMSDGEMFNASGYFELEVEEEASAAPPSLSMLGGIIGIALVSVPLVAESLGVAAGTSGWVERARTRPELESNSTILPLSGLVLAGLGVGLLTNAVLAIIVFAGLAAVGWTLRAL